MKPDQPREGGVTMPEDENDQQGSGRIGEPGFRQSEETKAKISRTLKARLTKREKLFVAAVLADPEASYAEAARRAGCPPKTAKDQASRMLRKPDVKALIDQQMDAGLEEAAANVGVTIENILRDLVAARAAATERGDIPNRIRANELLGRHLGMWKEKTEAENDVFKVLADRLQRAKLREEQLRKEQLKALPEPPKTIDGIVVEEQKPEQDFNTATKTADQLVRERAEKEGAGPTPESDVERDRQAAGVDGPTYDDWVERLLKAYPPR
jgi:phage terminase small subunit